MADRFALETAALVERAVPVRDFTVWVGAEWRRVFLLCHHLLQDWDEADSAAQDAFLKAFQFWRKRGFDGLDDPSRWLTRIAVNTCLDRLRSRRWLFWRRRPTAGDERAVLAAVRDRAPDAEAQVLAAEIELRLAEALGRLTSRQRAVFSLRHFEDRSLEEIGEILDLDSGTVKSHLSRALGKLRVELRDLYGVRKDSR